MAPERRGARSTIELDMAGAGIPPEVSWLRLLHPDGPSVPDRLPRAAHPDVWLLAPAVGDLRRPGWLGRVLEGLARDMAPDGLAYVVVPRAWRLHAVRRARQHGLDAGPWFLHLPSLESTQRVIPIEPRALRYATGVLPSRRRWLHRLLLPTLAAGGARMLPLLLSSAGVVVRKPGARPLLQWLLSAPPPGAPARTVDAPGTAVLAPSWRGPLGSVILHVFRDDERWPDVIAKVAPVDAAAALEIEAANLTRFGPDARRAGAIVPDPLALRVVGSCAVLLQAAVKGRPAAVHLASRPAHLPDIAYQLAAWLGRWHTITRLDGLATARELSSPVLHALDRLSPHVAGSTVYRGWLVQRMASLSGASIPRVAAHNDLTMANVLIGTHGALGVVDWEHASAESLPLMDFFYAMTDAVMAAGRHTDRLAAVKACAAPGGAHTSLVTRLWRRLTVDLRVPDDLGTVAFHACWLQHGANAHAARDDRADARGFVDIVRWLAERHVDVRLAGHG